MIKAFRFSDFSGGINDSVPADQIADNEVVKALNVIFDKQSNLKVRKGLVKVNSNKNLASYSEEFDNAFWAKSNSTVTPNTNTAPDSTVTADTYTSNLATNGVFTTTIAAQNDEIFTASCYVKKVTTALEFVLRLGYRDGTSINYDLTLDLSDDSFSAVSSHATLTVISFGVEDAGDYWRLWITGQNDATGNTQARISLSLNSVGNVVIWGAQLEKGLLSNYHKNVATAPTVADNYLSSRINSILDFKQSSGVSALLANSGSDLWRLNANDYMEKISGGLSFPNDTYWQWAIYDDVALGVTGATTASNKVGIFKVTGVSSNAEELNWNRNLLIYTEQFNQNIWIPLLFSLPDINFNTDQDINSEYTADTLDNNHTNVIASAREIGNSDWTIVGTPLITLNYDLDPLYGLKEATLIEDDDGSVAESVYENSIAADSDTWVGSFFIRKTTGSLSNYPIIRMRFLGGSGTLDAGAYIDTTNGTITNISAGFADTFDYINIESYGNYWRVHGKFTNNATGNNDVRLYIYPAGFNGSSFSSAPTGSAVFWGAQLEKVTELTNFHVSIQGISQTINVRDSENYQASIYIKKTGVVTYYPVIQLKYEGGTTPKKAGIIIDTDNGVLYDRTSFAPDSKAIIDAGSYWRVHLELSNNASGNDELTFEVYPARATALTGALNNFAKGENVFWGAQLEKSESLHAYKKNTNVSYVKEPPHGKYIAIWKNRTWIVDADRPNTLHGSGLGDFEDFASVGVAGSNSFEVGGEEGNNITAIYPFKDRLLIFKSNKIYYLVPETTPDTDITNYAIKELNNEIGCISAFSIQEILDDIVFLSKYGIASLSAVERFGDFESSLISQKIRELSDFKSDSDNSASAIIPEEAQYILAAPLDSGSIHSSSWVMDFSNIQRGSVGFTQFDNKIAGATYTIVDYLGKDRLYIGGYTQADDENIAYIYRYGDSGIYNDDGELYNTLILSKAYNLDEPIKNKLFNKVYFIFEILTDTVSVSLAYLFNESQFKIKSWSESFTGDVFIGAIWDTSLWDTSLWAVQDSLIRKVSRKVLGSPGRLGISIQFIIANVKKDEAFILKTLAFDAELASDWKE